jgi:hypothetical protein
MKKILLISTLLVSLIGFSQDKMITKSGTLIFDASFPSFQEVRGTNTSMTFVLNPETGEVASLALMKGFGFEMALMEEHFNENYMETDQYPKAIFRGQIEGFERASLTSNPKDFIIKGKLELHGKSKDMNVQAKISKTGPRINISSTFSVNTSDFNIPIPTLIQYKLASKVDIQMAVVLTTDYK